MKGGCKQVELCRQLVIILCQGIGSNCTEPKPWGGVGRLAKDEVRSEDVVGIGETRSERTRKRRDSLLKSDGLGWAGDPRTAPHNGSWDSGGGTVGELHTASLVLVLVSHLEQLMKGFKKRFDQIQAVLKSQLPQCVRFSFFFTITIFLTFFKCRERCCKWIVFTTIKR